VGDDPQCVTENLNKIKKTIGAEKLVYMEQVHGTNIVTVGPDHDEGREEIPRTDAMITSAAGIALMVKQADCQGVTLFDPIKRVLGVVHCGWRGNVQNILGRVLKVMKEKFTCDAKDILGAIGPSLGPCCGEFVDHKRMFPSGFAEFRIGKNHFDLWSLSRRQLMDEGMEESHIETAGLCTRCRPDLFYSYRGAGKTGRFATVAMLSEQGERGGFSQG
jgi:YfiH family protein